MNTVKIEVNGLDITALADKIDNLTNVLNGQSRPEPKAANDDKLITRTEAAQMLGVLYGGGMVQPQAVNMAYHQQTGGYSMMNNGYGVQQQQRDEGGGAGPAGDQRVEVGVRLSRRH